MQAVIRSSCDKVTANEKEAKIHLLYFDHNEIVQLGTELKMPFHLAYLVETLNGYTFFSFLYLTDGKRNKQEPMTRRAELTHVLLRDPRCFLRRRPGEHWGRGETNLTGASLRWNVMYLKKPAQKLRVSIVVIKH